MARQAWKSIAAAAALTVVSGCSTWDNMSNAQKGTVIGAGTGAAAGAVITDGGALGTIGGGVVGGIIGHEVGENKDDRK
jgi:osmotically inducible lipoprotein OsmB